MNCGDSRAGLSSLYPGMQSSTHWVTDHMSPCETIVRRGGGGGAEGGEGAGAGGRG